MVFLKEILTKCNTLMSGLTLANQGILSLRLNAGTQMYQVAHLKLNTTLVRLSSSVHPNMQKFLTCQKKSNWVLPVSTQQSHRSYMRRKTIKLPPTKPLSFDYAGDIEKNLPELDPKEARLGFEDIQELEGASDSVKKIFSLEFANRNVWKEKIIKDLLKKVQENPLVRDTLEVRIATLTILIRSQIKHCLEFRKDKRGKSQLVNRIQLRRKLLKELRMTDFEKFEWLCNELKLTYTPVPEYNFRTLSKRATRKQVARQAAIAVQQAKMEEFKQKLEKEKQSFLEFKEKEIDDIDRQLRELGIERAPQLTRTIEILKYGDTPPKKPVRKTRRQLILEEKFRRHAEKVKQEEAATT